jgi:hypothetical protein
MRMIFLISMLAAYGIAAFFGVIAALSQDSNVIRMVGTSLLFAAAFTVLLLLALLRDRGRRSLRWLMAGAMIITGPVFLLYLVLTWGSFGGGADELLARLATAGLFLILWSLYVGFCFCIRVQATWFHVMTLLLVASSLFFLLLLELLMIDEDIVETIVKSVFPDEEIFFRGLVALIILTSTATLSLPVIWLITKLKRGGDTAMTQKVMVDMTCPRCSLKQQLPVGTATCGQCRLEIAIRIDEPRCDCGFLLYRFDGATCPECGRAISSDKRWVDFALPSESGAVEG